MARRKRTKTAVYRLKSGAKSAFHGISTILIMFSLLIIASSSFILYQYKEYKITELAEEIQTLKLDILKLASQNSRYQGLLNSRLLRYQRIAAVAKTRLHMKESLHQPAHFRVDKKQLEYYVRLDQKEDESRR